MGIVVSCYPLTTYRHFDFRFNHHDFSTCCPCLTNTPSGYISAFGRGEQCTLASVLVRLDANLSVGGIQRGDWRVQCKHVRPQRYWSRTRDMPFPWCDHDEWVWRRNRYGGGDNANYGRRIQTSTGGIIRRIPSGSLCVAWLVLYTIFIKVWWFRCRRAENNVPVYQLFPDYNNERGDTRSATAFYSACWQIYFARGHSYWWFRDELNCRVYFTAWPPYYWRSNYCRSNYCRSNCSIDMSEL